MSAFIGPPSSTFWVRVVAWFEGGFAGTLDKVVEVGDEGVQIVIVCWRQLVSL